MKRHLFPFCLGLFLALPSASAQDWAKKMFEVTHHDFGTVPKEARSEFHFRFKNPYAEDVHIVGVRSSCGCTTPTLSTTTLKSMQEGEVLAHFNTGTFVGVRHATLTVTIDKPYPAEVQLDVTGTIRTDVVLTPAFIDLGQVDSGMPVEKKVQISYRGTRNDWRIVDVLNQNANLEVELTPAAGGTRPTNYELRVRLKSNAPAGFVKEQLLLVTNEGNGAQITVEVEGSVVPELTVSPSSLFLGATQPGGSLTKMIAVRGKHPFRVLKIESDDPAFHAQISASQEPLQMVPITFVADGRTGKISTKLRIITDSRDSTPEIVISAQVNSSTPQANSGSDRETTSPVATTAK